MNDSKVAPVEAQAVPDLPVAWQNPDCPRHVISSEDKRDAVDPRSGAVQRMIAEGCTRPLFTRPTPAAADGEVLVLLIGHDGEDSPSIALARNRTELLEQVKVAVWGEPRPADTTNDAGDDMAEGITDTLLETGVMNFEGDPPLRLVRIPVDGWLVAASPAAAALPKSWEDRDDQWTQAIDAAHPIHSGAHKQYATALEMVGNRHSKGALVELVCWLLQPASPVAPVGAPTRQHSVHLAVNDAEQDFRDGSAPSARAPYLCPDGCGCMWRDNGDGTMSLLDGSQKSCDGCERLPLSKLTRMTVHDNLFIDNRGDGVWLVCLDKVHSTMEEAQRDCRAWIRATTPQGQGCELATDATKQLREKSDSVHLADALRLILPMAKGYAYAHPVGDNAGKVQHAQEALDSFHLAARDAEEDFRRRPASSEAAPSAEGSE